MLPPGMGPANSAGGTPCKHFEVCQIPATDNHEGAPYCVLHHPVRHPKHIPSFTAALEAHMQAGRADFRFVRFPAGLGNPDLSNRTFPASANFSGAEFDGALNLGKSVFSDGLRISCRAIGPVVLEDARIAGDLHFEVERFNADLNLSRIAVGAPWTSTCNQPSASTLTG